MSLYLRYTIFLFPFLLVILFQFPIPPWPDAIVYHSVAHDFLNTGIFRSVVLGEFDPSYLRANFDSGPMFSLLHLVIIKLFGTTDGRLMLVVNYLLVLLSMVNIAKCLQLRGNTAWALILIGFNPLIINSAGLIRPEWLNVYFLSWVWRLFACHRHALSHTAFCATVGLFLALAAQTHYFSIFFVPIVIYELWITERTLGSRLKTGVLIATFTLLFLIPYITYLIRYLDDFKIQVFVNQFATNASHSTLKYLQHFFQPLVFPSSTIYTESHIIPRWLPVLFQITLVAGIVGGILRWRHHILLSSTTRQAIVIWLLLNLGTAVVCYTPYVVFYFSVAVAALWRDVFPHLHWNFRRIVVGMMVASLAFMTMFYIIVRQTLFTWPDYEIAVDCLAAQLPQGAKVYALAYPDPSVALANKRPDLTIRRYIDFARYADPWAKIVSNTRHFITSGDGHNMAYFDHGGALRRKMASGALQESRCMSGPVDLRLWTSP